MRVKRKYGDLGPFCSLLVPRISFSSPFPLLEPSLGFLSTLIRMLLPSLSTLCSPSPAVSAIAVPSFSVQGPCSGCLSQQLEPRESW